MVVLPHQIFPSASNYWSLYDLGPFHHTRSFGFELSVLLLFHASQLLHDLYIIDLLLPP
jgi:hypothetical protein